MGQNDGYTGIMSFRLFPQELFKRPKPRCREMSVILPGS